MLYLLQPGECVRLYLMDMCGEEKILEVGAQPETKGINSENPAVRDLLKRYKTEWKDNDIRPESQQATVAKVLALIMLKRIPIQQLVCVTNELEKAIRTLNNIR